MGLIHKIVFLPYDSPPFNGIINVVIIMHYIYDSINNYSDKDYESFYNKLNKHDKNKVDLLIREKDKRLTILSRMLLDKLLNKYYDTSYSDVLIKYSKYNKPYIDNINFSISHSNNYACVVVSDKNVGIDIELIRDVDINIINYICNENEKDSILNSKDRYKSLFSLYCLKEASVKLIGTGISNIKNIDIRKYNTKLDYSVSNYVIAVIEEKD